MAEAIQFAMHPLDNVIWQALTTRQAQFAEASGSARRFIRDVTMLSAFEREDSDGYGSLAGLVAAGGTTGVFLDAPYEARSGWQYVAGAPLLQMICDNGVKSSAQSASHPEIVDLGLPDSPDMLELTALTKPGPFGTRTHELGNYVGIRENGKLIAMAGERLKVVGFTEISGVCTHPEHTGRGYAATLISEVMRRIRERGEIPFLHVRQDNTRAVALYEHLGFKVRKLSHFAVLRRSADHS